MGWTQLIKPLYRLEMEAKAISFQNSADLEDLQAKQIESLMECCNQALIEDGFQDEDGHRSTRAAPISGAMSRVAVMCALHFDFCQALKHLMSVGNTKASQF